jgi:hypothetical protein
MLLLLIPACSNNKNASTNEMVARSGPVTIYQSDLTPWMSAFAQTPGAPKQRVPDAPSFNLCSKGLKSNPDAPRSLAGRKAACKQGYTQLQKKSLTWLLNSISLRDQAKQRGWLSSMERQVSGQIKESSKNKAFLTDLNQSGLSLAMAQDRILVNRIAERIAKESSKIKQPSKQQVLDYLNEKKLNSFASAQKSLFKRNQKKAVAIEFKKIAFELTQQTSCLKKLFVKFCSKTLPK